MDYKEKLKALKESEDWEQLLTESLALYEDGNEDRYIIRMIIQTYEELGREEDAVGFWKMLAREEHHSEEFMRKLIGYYERTGDGDAWILWSRRLLNHALKKREYTAVEDVWMQFVETKNLEYGFAMEIAERLISQQQSERAFTLLDIFLLALKDNPQDALAVAKKMLELQPDNLSLRKRTEQCLRHLHASCSEMEQFLEQANIRKSDDVFKALKFFEQLIQLCPGNYVSHKSWGIGRIRSVDLLFGKVFVDFPTNPNHAIEVQRALTMLQPLAPDAFEVQKREAPSTLKKLKQENPTELIKLLLKERAPLTQKRVKAHLEGIVADDEWQTFFARIKKDAKGAGLKLTRRGSSYLFSLLSEEEEGPLSLQHISVMRDPDKKLSALLSFAKGALTPDDVEQWTVLADELLKKSNFTNTQELSLLLARKAVTNEDEQFQDSITEMVSDMAPKDKVSLIESLPKLKQRKQLLTCLGEKSVSFTKTVFQLTGDDALRSHALKMLGEKTGMPELLGEVLQNPFHFPLCFLYCTEKALKEEKQPAIIAKPIIILETLLELMVHDDMEKVRARARRVFQKFGFDLYRWMLETSSREETTVLLDMIKKHTLIESAEKLTFEKLAESRFPTLKEKPREHFFYATRAAIKKKQKELDRLIKIEIPANSAEIGRAAQQGDLSENFDYISAKEKQRKLIDRTNSLKKELAQVQPIEEVAFKEDTAGIGTLIAAQSKETGKVREIIILGPWDAIPEKNIISHSAPLAQEIMGKKTGETFFDSFHSEHLEILKVSRYSPDH